MNLDCLILLLPIKQYETINHNYTSDLCDGIDGALPACLIQPFILV
jgi:hypothetical protein